MLVEPPLDLGNLTAACIEKLDSSAAEVESGCECVTVALQFAQQLSMAAGKAGLTVPKGLDAHSDKMIAPFEKLKDPPSIAGSYRRRSRATQKLSSNIRRKRITARMRT